LRRFYIFQIWQFCITCVYIFSYITIKKNPSKTLERKLNETLKNWYKKEYISKKEYFSLHSSDCSLPKAYGLPKIHKTNTPFRIIVSSINTALYSLAAYLQNLISDSLENANSYVNNSFDLYNTVQNKQIGESDVLISLDATSLFTNIPLDLAIKSVSSRWTYIQHNTKVPKNEFISAIEFILSSTFFTFNNVIYQQTFGTPMGSPLSPIIADIVMQDLETCCLRKANCQLSFYFRYVDDIVMATPSD